jgi:hypothetical protein
MSEGKRKKLKEIYHIVHQIKVSKDQEIGGGHNEGDPRRG